MSLPPSISSFKIAFEPVVLAAPNIQNDEVNMVGRLHQWAGSRWPEIRNQD